MNICRFCNPMHQSNGFSQPGARALGPGPCAWAQAPSPGPGPPGAGPPNGLAPGPEGRQPQTHLTMCVGNCGWPPPKLPGGLLLFDIEQPRGPAPGARGPGPGAWARGPWPGVVLHFGGTLPPAMWIPQQTKRTRLCAAQGPIYG